MTIRRIARNIMEKGASWTVLDMEIRSGKSRADFRFREHDAFEFLAECFDLLKAFPRGKGDGFAGECAKFLETCPEIVREADRGRTADMMDFYGKFYGEGRLRSAVLRAVSRRKTK